MITVIAGGVGAARFLSGLLQVVPPSEVTAIVNVGDDVELHGLWISPDLDTVTYTLAEQVNATTGWGLIDESWRVMAMMGHYGLAPWFNLGDRDLGTHLYRTTRRLAGAPLSTITAEIAAAWGLGCRIVPVSDDRVETRVTLAGGDEVGFQEYFVKLGHDVPISGVRFAGIDEAGPAPGVLEAIERADVVVIAPSNPIVSIGPVLGVPGVRDAIEARRDTAVAVSPIIAGRALKGPADRMLRELGEEPTVVGIARRYRHLVGTLVIDEADAEQAGAVRAEGVRAVVTPTIMSRPGVGEALARITLEAGGART
ncbi:MAG: 2-phospho-L-lactate transferase [Acidimicrobiales bacterium]